MKKLIKKYFQSIEYLGYRGSVNYINVIIGVFILPLVPLILTLFAIFWSIGFLFSWPAKRIANWLNS